jgi:hypothetical protein
MCLYSEKKIETTTAETDIPVYKVLYRPDRKALYPPLYNDGRPYVKGKVLHTILDEMEGCVPEEIGTDDVYVFHEYRTSMGFYSAATMKGAKEFRNTFCYPKNKCKIYRCTIPKGANYITDGETYVSDALKVVRRCIIQ